MLPWIEAIISSRVFSKETEGNWVEIVVEITHSHTALKATNFDPHVLYSK